MKKQMSEYENKLYKSACHKWGKEVVDDSWEYWDPIEIEQGFIVGTQTVLDIADKKNSSALEDEILHSSILTIGHIDELNAIKEYSGLDNQSIYSYMGFNMTHREKLAFDKGIMVDIELLHLLARFDDDNEDNDINRYWYVVKCTENDKLKAKLKGHFRDKYKKERNETMNNQFESECIVLTKRGEVLFNGDELGAIQFAIDLEYGKLDEKYKRGVNSQDCYSDIKNKVNIIEELIHIFNKVAENEDEDSDWLYIKRLLNKHELKLAY